ncbi:MAG: M20/M25/M40 family metallo-hydrolase [Oscillospiraceae bacterium]|nr:M20/M25/M40 family metallo-hydrolase [Oscillospiraceae bacterium]
MEKRILEILSALVSMKSLTCSEREREPAQWFVDFFRSMPYFQRHPELTGAYAIPGDPYGRSVPYALLRGSGADTVVLSGHFDVVSSEEYGTAEDCAYAPLSAALERLLRDFPLDALQRRDLASGEWLWGRGVADMKGGLSVHAALFEAYAAQAAAGTLKGCLLFVPVPDEESYSAGMRAAAEVFRRLQHRYGLNYRLLIDPEPTRLVDDAQVVSLGSVGKLMPAILVQTKKAHAGRCFEGFSALSVLTDIYQRTNGALAFSDVHGDEATVPPTWACLRDRKQGYDVSIPHRAAGYFTVLSFSSTPEDVERRLMRICTEAFTAQVERLDRTYQQFKTMNRSERQEHLHYEPCVMSVRALCGQLRERDGARFTRFYADLYERTAERVRRGEQSYPDATVDMMEALLNYSDIRYPMTLIGFAPPYYPSVHSDHVPGKEGTGSKALRFLSALSARAYGRPLVSEHFFMGISDLSYSAVTAPFDYAGLSENMPLWGEAYHIDFDAMEQIAIPSIIYGPIGRDYHTYAERVNKHSLLHVLPETTKALIDFLWTE